jgi:putative endonuclease
MRSSGTSYFVYIVATNDLARRVREHRMKQTPGFTATYNVDRLVWFEEFADPGAAISREKQLKNWTRAKKIKLIESMNPAWNDLNTE